MKKQSLDEIEEKFLEAIENSNIDNVEKIELLVNIKLFLENYKDNIRILQEYGKKRR